MSVMVMGLGEVSVHGHVGDVDRLMDWNRSNGNFPSAAPWQDFHEMKTCGEKLNSHTDNG